jgi:hypothetical protein
MAVTIQNIYDRYNESEIYQVSTDIIFSVLTTGTLEQFKRYTIKSVGALTDFTVVGSPDNAVGTSFNCTNPNISPVWDGGSLQKGKSIDDNINEYLDNARVDLNGYALMAGGVIDETNSYQIEFLVCQCMALMCENAGLTSRANDLMQDGLKALFALWGSVVYEGQNMPENALPPVRPIHIGITKCDYSEFDASMGF